jgi:hypothetical protein
MPFRFWSDPIQVLFDAFKMEPVFAVNALPHGGTLYKFFVAPAKPALSVVAGQTLVDIADRFAVNPPQPQGAEIMTMVLGATLACSAHQFFILAGQTNIGRLSQVCYSELFGAFVSINKVSKAN